MKSKKTQAHPGKFPPMPRLHSRFADIARSVKAKPLRGGLCPALTSSLTSALLHYDGGSGGNNR